MLRSRWTLFLFSLCFVGNTAAQQLITVYSVDQGLPQSTVTSMYRDNEGYLWCGTGAGIGLYDGWQFHSVKSTGPKENPSLNSIVRGIVPSTDQKTIWVGTESSLNQFDRLTYRLLHSFDIDKRPGIGEVPIYANDTALWAMISSQGLYRIRIADGRSARLTNEGFLDHAGMAADGQSIVFIDTTHQICIYNVLTNTATYVVTPASLGSATVNCVKSLPGQPKSVLIASSHGLWMLNLDDNTIKRFQLGNPLYNDTAMNFRAFDFHPDGSLWLGAQGLGVFRYDMIQHTLRPCNWQQDGTNAAKYLANVTSISCDAYGVVWCGTDGAGVVKMLHNRVVFHERFTQTLVTDTCNWFCRSFYELSPDRYLVGTYRGGLRLVNHTTNTITTITTGPLWQDATPFFITESGDGRLLIGTDKNLLLLDTTDYSTTAVDVRINFQAKYIGSVRLNSGDILVYGSNAMRKLELGPVPRLSDIIGRTVNITSAILLSDGTVAVSTYYEGIEIIKPDLNIDKVHSYQSIGISDATIVRRLYQSSKGAMYLATDAGLSLLDANYKLSRTLTVDDGLSDRNIYDMVYIGNDELLLSTGHGITILNLITNKCLRYSGGDGLPSEECNTGALLLSESGLLYVGTPSGFVRWNPANRNTCYRKCSILASFTENESGSTGIINESIVRDYGSGSVEVNIWTTDFAFPERTMYGHKLDGADAAFSNEMGLRRITYAALGSGFYSLLVTAAIPGCEETGTVKLLTIKIVPPFWISGWFIAISIMGVVVIITLILFVVMRMNYQRKLRKLRMQQELDKVRQRISRDIHDEIGAGLTRIALSGDLMSQRIATDDAQYEKLKTIAGTARELSQSMKEVVWSVNPHYDNLDHMAAYFRSYVAGVAENGDLRFVYTADEQWPDIQVNPETRRNLLLILKESISNAVKYSQATELRLELHWKNNQFSMLIADNGKGFDLQAAEGVNSNGLRNIRQRAEASGCIATITSSPQNGTSIGIVGAIEKI